jgi:hypothetical protein
LANYARAGVMGEAIAARPWKERLLGPDFE